jgi:nucleobase:cation symporter-1, NCS1 family
VFLMIASIWPSFGQRPSLTRSLAMGATVNYMIGFILFWLGSLPFIWFPVHKIRHLFTVKAIVSPTGGIALLIWSVVRAGGVGPIVRQGHTAHGSDLAWGVSSRPFRQRLTDANVLFVGHRRYHGEYQ